ncbi:MAG: methyltransferase domain-containing protein [Tildeniella nuda ZEHNDER 1965/U140]|jgi:SAM-dependent methyltransferase|nr:methyltransferase domain-containing protein [Tildeniella nuda ZEHNDER 1965/U140]
MAKKQKSESQEAFSSNSYFSELSPSQDWQSQIAAVTLRFNREYRGEAFDLPEEVEAMPIFRDRASGALQSKLASPFWELAQPKKNQHCLDLGCGVSFLIYPWRDWEALFYGQEISHAARDSLNARGPQLNSKLFKGVALGAAHQLEYEANQFDLAIATGFSCYYPLDYWAAVLTEVKRVLKPGGVFVFDVLDPETPLAENWAILEMYLGTEVFLEPIADWKKLIQSSGGKIVKTLPGEVFQLFKVQF